MNRFTLKSLLLIIICFISQSPQLAHAHISHTYQAYKQQDYAEAFKHFEHSAHLGDINAQLKLSGLYANGLGVTKDLVKAYIYLALAGDHGNKEAQEISNVVLHSLTTEQQVKASQLWQQYQTKYGRSSLANTALPIFVSNTMKKRPARPKSRGKKISGSMFLPRKTTLSSAIIEFDVGVDGKVRDIEVDNNYYMDHVGIDNILRETKQLVFHPAKELGANKHKITSFGHRTVWAQQQITKSYVKKRAPKFYRKLKSLKKSADQGNPYLQYKLAMLYLLFPSLEADKAVYADYIEQAANAEVPEAQVEYATLLFRGKYFQKDPELAINYLLRAAQAGYSRAQYKLARHFLSGRFIDKNQLKAMFWLTQASGQQEQYAKFWLARLYLTIDEQELRKPELAKELLDTVALQQRENPNWYYYKALTEAAMHNNKLARSLLNDAIERAKILGWDLTEFQLLAASLFQE